MWDGVSQAVDLTGPRPAVCEVPLPIRQEGIARAEAMATRLAQVVFLTTLVFFVGQWLVLRSSRGNEGNDPAELQTTLTPDPSPIAPPGDTRREVQWERGAVVAAYALPCLIAWTYYLWVFWPGAIHIDGLVQWRQVQSGQFDDAHPALPYDVPLVAVLRLEFADGRRSSCRFRSWPSPSAG